MVVIVAIAISSIITLTSSSSSFCFFTTPITTPHLSNSLAPLFDKIRIFDSYGHIVNVKHAYNKHKATYKDVVRTLVQELVHYRFSYMQHGRKFETRIDEILKGKIFEPKHVHLFAGYPKSKTL